MGAKSGGHSAPNIHIIPSTSLTPNATLKSINFWDLLRYKKKSSNYHQLKYISPEAAGGHTLTFVKGYFKQASMHSDCARKKNQLMSWSYSSHHAGVPCMLTVSSCLTFSCSTGAPWKECLDSSQMQVLCCTNH